MNEKDIRKIIKEELERLNETRMVTYTSEILSRIGREITNLKTLDIQSTGDGSIGLYRYEKDGNAYEIQIRPASLIKDKYRWGNKLVSKEHPSKPMFRDLGINK